MEAPVLLTGGAGFIGSHVLDRLLGEGFEVVVLDNFSSGYRENIAKHLGSRLVRVVEGDIRVKQTVQEASQGCRTIIHLAANPEVRMGDPEEHLEHNVRGTLNILEVARRLDVSVVAFASSSTVYGEATLMPTPEDYSPMRPISTYGASKLACEALLSAYAYTYNVPGVALRYANVVGPRARRGVVYDFTRKLLSNPHRLEILGDGTQKKSYIWVGDAVEASLTAIEKRREAFEAFNVGSIDAITVREVADAVCDALSLKGVEYVFVGGPGGRGWPGDVKYMHLDVGRLISLGWRPRYVSREAVILSAQELKRELSKGF
ncbi:MAG: NAD-dependent epimerase/dehydratase family protein [Nitrososphaerota archaeon]|nr:NAD-dependent epimerase/dehydratase family protein [Candidatus Calditenuaceae archaeon]MDW8073440.1 NAD-dependent epimerase/dehydratase family protein [Nitrososphaerota archaeon]